MKNFDDEEIFSKVTLIRYLNNFNSELIVVIHQLSISKITLSDDQELN